jgi:hypothetical protein
VKIIVKALISTLARLTVTKQRLAAPRPRRLASAERNVSRPRKRK